MFDLTVYRLWNYQGDEPIAEEVISECQLDAEQALLYMGEYRPGFGIITDADGSQYRWEERTESNDN